MNAPKNDMLALIEEMERYYDPLSPSYRFNFVFYNLVSQKNFVRPASFPLELWESAVLCAPSKYHYPILIKGYEELKQRNKLQNEVIQKLNNTNEFLRSKVDKLRIKSENINKKLENTVKNYRLVFQQLYTKFGTENRCELKSEILKIRNEVKFEDREMFKVKNKNEVIDFLEDMKDRLNKLNEKVKTDLKIKKDKENIFK